MNELLQLYSSLERVDSPLYKKIEDNLDMTDKTLSDIASKIIFTAPKAGKGEDLSAVSIQKKGGRGADALHMLFDTCAKIQKKINSLQASDYTRELDILRLTKFIKIINAVLDLAEEPTQIRPHIQLQLPKDTRDFKKYTSIMQRILNPPKEIKTLVEATEKLEKIENFYNKKEPRLVGREVADLIFEIEKELTELENLPTEAAETIHKAGKVRERLETLKKRGDFMELSEKQEALFKSIENKGLESRAMLPALHEIYAKLALQALFIKDMARKAAAVRKLATLHDRARAAKNLPQTFSNGVKKFYDAVQQQDPSFFFPEIASRAEKVLKNVKHLKTLFAVETKFFEQLKGLGNSSLFLKEKSELYAKVLREKIETAKTQLIGLDGIKQFDALQKEARDIKEHIMKLKATRESALEAADEFAKWQQEFRSFCHEYPDCTKLLSLSDFDLEKSLSILINTSVAQEQLQKAKDSILARLHETEQTNNFTDVNLPLFVSLLANEAILSSHEILASTLAKKIDSFVEEYNKTTKSKAFHTFYKKRVIFQGEIANLAKQPENMKAYCESLKKLLVLLPEGDVKKTLKTTLERIVASIRKFSLVVGSLKTATHPQIANGENFLERYGVFLQNIEKLLYFLPKLQKTVQDLEKDQKVMADLRAFAETFSKDFLSAPVTKEMSPSALIFPGASDQRTIPVLYSQILPRMKMPLEEIQKCLPDDSSDRSIAKDAINATESSLQRINGFLKIEKVLAQLAKLEAFYNNRLPKKERSAFEEEEPERILDIEKNLKEVEKLVAQDPNAPSDINEEAQTARANLDALKRQPNFMKLSKDQEALFKKIRALKKNDKLSPDVIHRLQKIYAKEALKVLYSTNNAVQAPASEKIKILHDLKFPALWTDSRVQKLKEQISPNLDRTDSHK
jgi:hypothetical protein